MINFKDALSQHRPWQPSMCPNVQWFAPGDTESEWQANMNNTKRRGYLERQGWHHAHAIEYRYNQDGFRGSDFDLQQRALMVLGCSFTFGVGLAEKQVWPWIVAAQLGMPCMTLAWGGCGSDRCFRMAEYWVQFHVWRRASGKTSLAMDRGRTSRYALHESCLGRLRQ